MNQDIGVSTTNDHDPNDDDVMIENIGVSILENQNTCPCYLFFVISQQGRRKRHVHVSLQERIDITVPKLGLEHVEI